MLKGLDARLLKVGGIESQRKKIPDRVPTKSGPNPLSMGKLDLNRVDRL